MLELGPQDGLGEGTFHVALDGPPHGPGAVDRVVAPFGQPFSGRVGQAQVIALLLHPFGQTTKLDVHNLPDVLRFQGVEDDDLVDAV